ncbi:MAG: histidine phosphatase family protein [Actinomycetota bacterium]
MTTVFLVRHGLTAQTGTILYGRTEGIPLDHRGMAQAERLVTRFAGVRLTAVYSSPLERCLGTVEPLASAQRLRPETRGELIEMDAGSWTGKPLRRLRLLKAWHEVQSSPSTFRFPGGESYVEARERVVSEIERIARRHRQGRVVVATHGDIVRVLLNHYSGAPLDAFQRMAADTASVSVIAIGGGRAAVLLMNDTVGGLRRFGPGQTDAPWEEAVQANAHTAPKKNNLRG